MLPDPGKRKIVAALVFTAAAFIGGGGLLWAGKISGAEFVTLIQYAGIVVVAFFGTNVASGVFGGKK